MFPRSSALALLIAIVLTSSQLAHAQQNSTGNTQPAEAELREQAFNLLESLADQIGTLQSAENRARMGSNIAASLWTHNEKRARDLFTVVEDDIKLGLQIPNGTPNADYTFQVFLKLRADTAGRMVPLDPELALAFLRDTFPSVEEYARLPDGKFRPSLAQQENDLQLRIARQVGESNSEIAVRLARQSLKNGFSRDLLSVLRRAKDKAQTLTLYKDIVNKLSETDFANYQTLEFAQSLAVRYTPPAADQATYREFVHLLLTKMLAAGCGRRLSEHDRGVPVCGQMGALVPLMETFYAAEAQPLKHWVPQDGYARARRVGYDELNELAETATIDEVLSLTSKYPDLEGEIRYRAMIMAEAAGDWDQAEKIATSYNGDPQIRRTLEKRLKYYKDQVARSEQDWTTALRELSEVPLLTRIDILTDVARNLALRDRSVAVKALDQLSGMIDSLPAGGEQTMRQIVLAMLYCLAKSDRGFAIMEGLLPKLNELVAASAKLDGYDARYLRDGEWNMTAAGAVGNILTMLADNAAYFAWCDFDRAVTLAGQFERSEIRMMGQLKLAQGILAGPPKRLANYHRVIY